MQYVDILVDDILYRFSEDLDSETFTYKATDTDTVIGIAKADMMDVGTTISASYINALQQPEIFMVRHSSVEHNTEAEAHRFTIRTLVTMHEARLTRETFNHQSPALFLPYCSECGGTDIKADATARWDRARQQWGHEVHRSYFCVECHDSEIEKDQFIS